MMAQFEIYKDERLEFRWRLKANNGKILAESAEGYNNPAIASMRLPWSNNRLRTPESIVILSQTKILNEASP
jgi:uncharacterized protein YegP (UPF0339 family)